MVDSHHLRVFLTVATTGSVSAAADALHYVQPNISARIRQLESALGTTLFYRQSRGMELTADGRRLLPYARSVVETLEEIHRVHRSSETLEGSVKLGTTDTFAAVHLAGFVADLRARYPHLAISVGTHESSELIEMVSQCHIDGAFVELPVHAPHLDAVPVSEERLVLVAAPDHPHDTITSKDAIIVFPAGCGYRAALEEWFAEAGCAPSRIHEFRGLDAVLGCTAAGLGVTAVPHSVAERSRYPLREMAPPTSVRTSRSCWVTRVEAREISLVAAITRVVENLAHPPG